MSDRCPKCGQKAMDAMAKIMSRPVVCQNCLQEL